MSQMLHAQTPMITVIDGRTLVLQRVALYRNDADSIALPRATHQRFDAAGRLIAAQDPRLTSPNLRTIYSLSSQVLFNDSVDAGWRLALPGAAGQVVAGWDSRGSQRQIDYDELLRSVAITEQDRVVERFAYGGPEAFDHNQCNQLIRHDDTAGTRHCTDFGLLGSPLVEVRQFLNSLDMPDWPESMPERDVLLEPDSLKTRWVFNALGETLSQTDATGNIRHFEQTVAGELKSVSLVLAGNNQSAMLVDEILYNAFGQVEQERAGNGVISRNVYDPQDGRLNELHAALADNSPMQHLKYSYDPVGNILQIEDGAQPVRFFANQRIEPINHYRYDTLYQLIEATGREVITGSSHGPALPDLQNLPPDPDQIANYTQTYNYDAGGNLVQMRHVGAQTFTRHMRVAPDSNRSLPEGEVEVDFEAGFDANGNLLQLVRGQNLSWDARNQLQHITTVQRDEEPDDTERYVYDGQGQRCRKISSAQTSSRTLLNEVRYLPGLEIRTTADGEILHVITAQAGRNSVRVLHWQTGKPDGIANDQLRYSLSDHLGSSTLELDHLGQLLSQESYYPFGGTSWWAARSAVEAKYKTVRYSGKERDASGLYYYGFRYYAPWVYRWINPDPAGDVDGLNFFAFASSNPITNIDTRGLTRKRASASRTVSQSVRSTPYSTLREHRRSSLSGPTRETLDARPGALWGDPEELLGPAHTPKLKSYFSPNLDQRLIEAGRKSDMGSLIVSTMFSHNGNQSEAPYDITSTHWNKTDKFYNTYKPEEWIFRSNFKRSQSRDYHANDVVRFQAKAIADKMGFNGILPSAIKNSFVVNDQTLQLTSALTTKTPEMMRVFLDSTPNGKRTQRVLDDFDLEAVWVDRQGDPDFPFADFVISVQPKKTSSLHSAIH
ncbi:toxin [Pseudomonas syringae]|uniref:Toxin n=1 Tax=Pseudomonas syringae TaxID=317 RepID=A0A1C7Z4X9_PSESX|nr:RHS repeat-associated core domain-containing protein [Pseudomonas syringae]OCR23578.1 toxin [Pseudomonas syringae]